LSDIFQGQNDYLEQFMGHQKKYLNHLLDLEMPPNDLSCTACGQFEASFRCLDCFGSQWWCESCLVKQHAPHPFHRPQQWKDGSFENVSLCDLGYVITLPHSISGPSCVEDGNLFGDRRITLIHVNGIFEHCIRFCKCQGASPEHYSGIYRYIRPPSRDVRPRHIQKKKLKKKNKKQNKSKKNKGKNVTGENHLWYKRVKKV
jgi:hypothetical protein